MTGRIDSPLTPADRELHALLDQDMPRFTMISGAGSGKTTSLVKALAHIVETRGSDLRRQGQRVACITYTEVAAREIYSDLAETPLAHVSTIHSFLWTVIKPFQNDIRAWVADDTRRVIDKERATAATRQAPRRNGPRTAPHATRQFLPSFRACRCSAMEPAGTTRKGSSATLRSSQWCRS